MATDASSLMTSTNDILIYDEGSWGLFRGTALFVRPGSLSKVWHGAYQPWGINLTSENMKWLRERAEFFHLLDRNRGSISILTAELSTTFRNTLEADMIEFIANTGIEVLRSQDDGTKEFKVLDIGARLEKTLPALGTQARHSDQTCRYSLTDRVSFYFADKLQAKFEEVKRLLDTYGFARSQELSAGQSDRELLAKQQPGTFDLVVSFLDYHNRPFYDHLLEVRRVLRDDGIIILADWHSALWQNPQNVYVLLERLGADAHLLTRFNHYFSLPSQPRLVTNGLNDLELKAMADHLSYWTEIGTKMLSGTAKGSRRFFLGAHRTTRQTLDELNAAGFVTDMSAIRHAFPRAKFPGDSPKRVLRNSDFASVIVAMKRR